MRKVLLEFLESTGQLDLQTIVLRMVVAAVVGFFIYLSYMRSPMKEAFTAENSMFPSWR